MNVQETKVIYKTDGATQLKLHLFMPEGADQPIDKRAAIVFFHGGRFIQGHPAQFFPHCRYLASRGLVAASAAYRLVGKTATSIRHCLADSKSAIRWLRSHAGDFAIDPAKVVAAGGSAGANLAANAAMMNGGDEAGEALPVSSKPDALILFSPAVIRPISPQDLIDEQLYASLSVRPQVCPMLLLHGTEDEIFSTEGMKQFCEEMTAVGNLCELILHQGAKHGFFNYGRDENYPFYDTLLATDKFLGKLGMLNGHPTLTYEAISSLRQEADWRS